MIPMGIYGTNVYRFIAPATYADEHEGWPLAFFVNSAGQMFDPVEEIVRDTDDSLGWSIVVDIDRCPNEALDWLAQFMGVQIPNGLTEEQRRERIHSTDGWKRGSVAAILAAPLPYLSGGQTVALYERDTSPYHFTVITYRDETPPEDWPVQNLISNPSFESNTTGWTYSG